MVLKQKILFNKNECDSIIWNVNENITNWNKKDRKYQSHPIKYAENTKWIFDKLKNFFEEETGIKIRKLKDTIHFHKFEKGNWFDLHNDNKESRLYSVGVLLNDDFSGGNFSIYNPNETILNKKIGNSYLFDVKLEHKISIITDGIRYSLIWFLQSENLEFDKKALF